MARKTGEKIYRGILSIILILGFPLLFFGYLNNENIMYHCFYYPAYKLFAGGLYFPVQLQIAKQGIALLLIVAYVLGYIYFSNKRAKRKDKPTPAYLKYIIIATIILTPGIYLTIKPSIDGINSIISDKVDSTDVCFGQLIRHSGHGKFSGVGYSLDDHSLDLYQYTDLKQKKDSLTLTRTPGDVDMIKIKIYYIPDHNKVLKYEVLE